MANKIEYGLNNLHFALFNPTTKEFEDPQKIQGITTLTLSSKSDKLELYADNGVYFTQELNKGFDVELELYNFDDDFKIKFLSYKKDKNNTLIEPAVFNSKIIALLFEVEGDEKKRRNIIYNVTFSKPDYSHKTLEDKIEVQVLKLKGTTNPIIFENYSEEPLYMASIIEDGEIKNNWFKKVYKPVKNEE